MNSRDANVQSDEQVLEQQLQAKGLNAPRLTPADIDAQIVGEQYYVFPGTTMTVCLLALKNGFNVTGESAAASPENFDEQIGRDIAPQCPRQDLVARGLCASQQAGRGLIMRCYLVKGPGAKRYAATNADARAKRDELVEQLGCKKKDVEIEQAEVPVAKAELLEFINGLCTELDEKEAE